MIERHEEPVAQKRARADEEVVIRKDESERTEQVRDKVRETKVEEQEGRPEGRQDEHWARACRELRHQRQRLIALDRPFPLQTPSDGSPANPVQKHDPGSGYGAKKGLTT